MITIEISTSNPISMLLGGAIDGGVRAASNVVLVPWLGLHADDDAGGIVNDAHGDAERSSEGWGDARGWPVDSGSAYDPGAQATMSAQRPAHRPFRHVG